MNAVVGTIESKHESILTGEHHIISTVKMQDNIEGLKAGEVLVYTETGYRQAAANDTACDAVLLEDFDKTTEDTVLNVCVHGTVRAEKVRIAGGNIPDAAAAEEIRQKLRVRGIFAIGAFAVE